MWRFTELVCEDRIFFTENARKSEKKTKLDPKKLAQSFFSV